VAAGVAAVHVDVGYERGTVELEKRAFRSEGLPEPEHAPIPGGAPVILATVFAVAAVVGVRQRDLGPFAVVEPRLGCLGDVLTGEAPPVIERQ
jgi:hypothetical protein